MDLQASEFDRILFFEHARKNAESTYATNPLDAEVTFPTSLFPSTNFLLCFSMILRIFRFSARWFT